MHLNCKLECALYRISHTHTHTHNQTNSTISVWPRSSITELVDSRRTVGMAWICTMQIPYNFATNTLKALFKHPAFPFECFYDQQDSYHYHKILQKTAKHKKCMVAKMPFLFLFLFWYDHYVQQLIFALGPLSQREGCN